MLTFSPKVSIVIPVFNREELLPFILESVLSQTYSNWECIVVDDFSTDNSAQVIHQFEKRDSRIRRITNFRNKGAQGARNSGVLKSESDWIVFFDSDDLMSLDFIRRLVDEALATGVDVCTCFSNIRNRNTNELEGKFTWISEGSILVPLLSGETYVDYNAALIRKKHILEIGLLDEACPSFQEWDTHIRLSKVAQYHTVQEVLVEYFRGGADTISQNSGKYIAGYLYILGKHQKLWKELHPQSFYRHGSIVLRKSRADDDFSNYIKVYTRILFLMPKMIINKTKSALINFSSRLINIIIRSAKAALWHDGKHDNTW